MRLPWPPVEKVGPPAASRPKHFFNGRLEPPSRQSVIRTDVDPMGWKTAVKKGILPAEDAGDGTLNRASPSLDILDIELEGQGKETDATDHSHSDRHDEPPLIVRCV